MTECIRVYTIVRMKTLVKEKHSGRHTNGFGGCHTRWSNDGLCSGVRTAAWLNGLGEDSEPYTKTATCGDVRNNWLRSDDHIKRA